MAVDAKLLKQLRDPNPQVRRKAIVALADSRDLAALKPLAEVARDDKEPKLRDLAQRAQEHLKEQAERARQQAENPVPMTKAPVKVSEKDQARAKGFMEEAMSYYMAGDSSKAAQSCLKALKANPALKDDSYFLSMVGNIFNVGPDEALSMLFDSGKRSDFISTSKKEQIQKKKSKHRSHTEEIGWNSVIFDLGIYGVVMAVITFLAPFVYAQLISNAIQYQTDLRNRRPDQYQSEPVKFTQYDELVDGVRAAGAAPLVIAAVVSAGSNVLYILVLGAVVHVVATKMLGGTGTLPFMLCQIVPFNSMVVPVFFIWSCIVLGMLSLGAGVIGLLCVPLMGLAGLVVFFKMAGRIGSAYDFGAGKGCLSLVIASFLLSFISGLISYAAFGATLNAMMSSLM